MKIRLFIENLSDAKDTLLLSDDEHHYLKNVLKAQINDIVFIFNEIIEIECKVSEINKKTILLQIIQINRVEEMR